MSWMQPRVVGSSGRTIDCLDIQRTQAFNQSAVSVVNFSAQGLAFAIPRPIASSRLRSRRFCRPRSAAEPRRRASMRLHVENETTLHRPVLPQDLTPNTPRAFFEEPQRRRSPWQIEAIGHGDCRRRQTPTVSSAKSPARSPNAIESNRATSARTAYRPLPRAARSTFLTSTGPSIATFRPDPFGLPLGRVPISG